MNKGNNQTQSEATEGHGLYCNAWKDRYCNWRYSQLLYSHDINLSSTSCTSLTVSNLQYNEHQRKYSKSFHNYIDVELYRKQITLHLPCKRALMYFMNETADVVYKFNLSSGFEIIPDLVT